MTAQPQDVSNELKNKLVNENGNGIDPAPTPKNCRECQNISYGTLGNGATGISIFFSDGIRSTSISPAKYHLIYKEMQSAEARKASTIVIPLVINKKKVGFGNHFISKYAKVAFTHSNTSSLNHDSNDIMYNTRVLLCEYVLETNNFTSFTIQESFGIYVRATEFYGIKNHLFSNPHTLQDSGKADF